MSTRYILIQAIGLVGTILFFFSFQCKSNRSLFRIQLLSYLFYTIHLLLLGAVTGGISYIINVFRSFCLGSRWRFAKGKGMCAAICLAQILAMIFTWSGWISLLPVTANNVRGHLPRTDPGHDLYLVRVDFPPSGNGEYRGDHRGIHA